MIVRVLLVNVECRSFTQVHSLQLYLNGRLKRDVTFCRAVQTVTTFSFDWMARTYCFHGSALLARTKQEAAPR